MARIKYFNELPFGKKAVRVTSKGRLAGSRIYYQQKINLFSVGKLFVEVYYEPESQRIIWIEEIEYVILERFYLKNFKIN